MDDQSVTNMSNEEKAQLMVERVNEGNPDMSFLTDLWERVTFISMYRAQNPDISPFLGFMRDNIHAILSDDQDQKVHEVLARLGIARFKIKGDVQ